MDEQFRNRLRRYDNGAPLRPRPHQSPTSAPSPRPQPSSQPTNNYPSNVASQPAQPPYGQADSTSRREPIPPRPIFERSGHKASQKAQRPTRGRRRRGRKIILSVLVLLVLAGGGSAAAFWPKIKPHLRRFITHSVKTPTTSTPAVTQKPATKLIRLLAVGDSMAYSSLNQVAQSGGSYNYAPLMAAIQPLFTKADIRLCSQSVPAGGTAGGGVSGPPTFNAPPEFAKGLEATGCNVFDLANPNMNDKGQAAINASLSNFDNTSTVLATAGANRSTEEQSKIRYFTVSGLKFAYLSYTTSVNVANPTAYGVNIYSDTLADAQIKEAHKNATVVIVSLHWGTDQANDENSSQDTIASHLAADNADVIIGNGPHVIEPVKVLSGVGGHQTIVWFSLGNFLSSQVPTNTLFGGMAVMDFDATTGQLHDPKLLPLYMHYEWTAEQKQRQNDADLLARKNFQLVPLDQATALLAKSQNNTTVQAQQDRIKAIVNKYFTIPLITSTDL